MSARGAGWRWALAGALGTAVLVAAVAGAWQVARRATPGASGNGGGAARVGGAGTDAPPASASAGDVFELAPGHVVRFADPAEARRVLATPDDWSRATGDAQRRVLLPAGQPPTEAALLQWQADNVRAWTDAGRARWRRALAALAPRVRALGVPLPPEILLVSTTGRESDRTPHTRGDAIVLPEGADLQGFSDEDLLAHELFHVLSRRDPAMQTAAYALLGFEPVAELAWPAAWAGRRIADQDAPHLRHAMRVIAGDHAAWILPVVVALRDPHPASGPVTLDDLMDVRLLEVTPGTGGAPTRAVLDGGRPRWHRVEDLPAYLDRLGGNSDYVLHPEETCADNFMLLVAGRAVPNPGLLARLRAVVRGSGGSSAPGS